MGVSVVSVEPQAHRCACVRVLHARHASIAPTHRRPYADDNKTLTLVNGDRIGMPSGLRVLFETHDLAAASPATISRAGVVYVDGGSVPWQAVTESWVASRTGVPSSAAAAPSATAAGSNPMSPDTSTDGDAHGGRSSAVAARISAGAAEGARLRALFAKYVPRLLAAAAAAISPSAGGAFDVGAAADSQFGGAAVQAVASLCALLDAVLVPANGVGAPAAKQRAPSAAAEHLAGGSSDGAPAVDPATEERWFAFAAVWALGGALVTEPARRAFSDAVREVEPTLFPAQGVVYDFAPDGGAGWELRPWADRLPSTGSAWRPPADMPANRLLVPTLDTLRLQFVLRALVSSVGVPEGAGGVGCSRRPRPRRPVLLLGPTATAKTAMAMAELFGVGGMRGGSSVDADTASAASAAFAGLDDVARLLLPLSVGATPASVQAAVEGALEKRGKAKLGPPAGKSRLLVFIDDLSTPRCDAYGAQPALELLRQLVDCGGWWSVDKLAWRAIADVHLVATARALSGADGSAPTSGGGSGGGDAEDEASRGSPGVSAGVSEAAVLGPAATLPQRLRSRFLVLGVPTPSDATLRTVFAASFAAGGGTWLAAVGEEVRRVVPDLVAATVTLLARVAEAFPPSDASPQCRFSPRDVGRVVAGVTLADAATIDSREAALRLWRHEAHRVFADRLAAATDVTRFTALLDATAIAELGVLPPAAATKGAAPSPSPPEPLFATFARDALADGATVKPKPAGGTAAAPPGPANAHAATRAAEVTGGVAALRTFVQRELVSLVRTGTPTAGGRGAAAAAAAAAAGPSPLGPLQGVVLFGDALRHVARIARVLASPRGHMLLLGSGGSGRQSLSRLAAWLTLVPRGAGARPGTADANGSGASSAAALPGGTERMSFVSVEVTRDYGR